MANKSSTTHAYSSGNEDTYSAYSEDFEHDSVSPTPDNKRKYNPGNQRHGDPRALESEPSSSTITTSHHSGKHSSWNDDRRKTYTKASSANKKGWRSSSYSKDSKRKPPMPKPDQVRARMLSAQRNRINILNDELTETQVKIEQLVKENRYLKTLQHRQGKALQKFEDKEGELPKLINRHMEDERALKARLRKSQEAERQLEGRLKETNEEFQKMETTLRRLKKIVYDKNLGERSDLAKQLSSVEEKLSESERKNKELEKKVELTTQSFARQINGERAKHKETKQKLEALQEEIRLVQAKLKEKERALEVSNIYALRTKSSPDKSFIGKVTSSRQQLEASPQLKAAPSPLSITSPQQAATTSNRSEPPPPPTLPPSAEQERPSPSFIKATRGVTDQRKTIKSPANVFREQSEESSLLDFGSSTNTTNTEATFSGLNGIRMDAVKKERAEKKIERKTNRSVFLTANFDSPNSTFISDAGSSSPRSHSPPDSLNRYSPKSRKAPLEPIKTEKELMEERQKAEDERSKKAELLARIKDLEEQDNIIPPNKSKKSDDDDFRKLLSGGATKKAVKSESNDRNPENEVLAKQVKVYESNRQELLERKISFERKLIEKLTEGIPPDEDVIPDSLFSSDRPTQRKHSVKAYRFPKEVENLHKGIPSTIDNSKSSLDESETELTFGGYAPTVSTPPIRKPRTQQKRQNSPPESESDEALFDVASGKSKKNDFLQQLFGDQATKQSSTAPKGQVNKEKSFTSSRESSMIKTTPRAKPVHSSYPWERNVVPASQQGNGDGHLSKEKNAVIPGPSVKVLSAFNDDDIEEVIL